MLPLARLAATAAAVVLLAWVPAAGASAAAPVVWVQAGHAAPGEPGYRAQTGSGSGPFGGEAGFTTRLATAVVRRLRAAGVDARRIPARVPPGARGAVFVSLHHDTPYGAAAVGHAVHDPGRGENWYHGEGTGPASPVPYPDSAPHRAATRVSARVEARSTALARAVAARFGAVFTRANGARTRFRGVEPRDGNPRMTHFYGYYRSRAAARVLVECGAGGTDDPFLRRVDLIAAAVSGGVADHLRRRGLMP